MSRQAPFSVHKYLLMTLDPVHVGAGGYRLGRTELSIVREPGTRLPKIPGTSLSGAIRSYAAYRYGMRTCAGQKGHCGRPTCPICYTFGSVSERGSFSGVVSICDARILLFPVYSMAGPVWVTSPSVLRDYGVSDQPVAEDRAKWGNGITTRAHLNLGWLMVARDSSSDFQIGLPPKIPDDIRSRVVLVSDKLFSIVVNSNLEVRTSVSINPETGAAEEGALFTYEAIPRATVLWMEVVVDDFRGEFPSMSRLNEWEEQLRTISDSKNRLKRWGLWDESRDDQALDEACRKAIGWVRESQQKYQESGVSWTYPDHVVVAGLEWAEHLGIGGMGTRGFGRIRYLGEVEDGSASASNHQSGPAGHSTGSMDHGES